MRKKKKIILMLIVFSVMIISMYACSSEKTEDRGIFSWESDFISEASKEELKELSEEGITQIYQGFSSTMEMEQVNLFLKNAEKSNIDIYFLSGDPLWGLEEDAKSCLNEVQRVYELNDQISSSKIKGIVFDVEPYLTDEWKEDKGKTIELYVENMKKTYEASKEKGIELILCIPYYFDTEGFEEELEILIRDCCDKVAVMNYYRENESKHIETEFYLADRYEKQLINIYELKKPGEHGLIDKNTYYELGMEEVYISFENIKEYFSNKDIIMALHDLDAFYEVIQNE